MVRIVVKSLERSARFKLISVVYGAPRNTAHLHASESVVDVGWFGGPTWWRKIRYLLSFVYVFYGETQERFDTCWLIWVGFPGLTRLAIRRAHKRGFSVVTTVLSRSTPVARYAESDVIVLNSPSLIKKYGRVSDAKIVVIPPPAAADARQIRLSLQPPHPYFVFASAPRTRGQIHDRGVDLLFDACAQLHRAGDPLTVKFLNRWPKGRALLARLKARYDAVNVEIIDDHIDDLGSLIAQGCGVVIPYKNLNQGDIPLSAVEAWAVGRPIVSTALPGVVELLSRYDAGKVSGLSGSSLANTMKAVAESAALKRESCLALARQFDSRTFVAQYSELLLQRS